MIHVNFDPEELPEDLKAEWKKLNEEVTTKIKETILEYEKAIEKNPNNKPKLKWKSEKWHGIRDWLKLKVFNGKCAYCETKNPRFHIHAEHYRPKGSVCFKGFEEEKDIKPIVALVKDANGNDIEHPGYFWLAYNWKNLFPTCHICNNGKGKGTQFPVKEKHIFIMKLSKKELASLKAKPYKSNKWSGYYYLQPEDLDERENPLLLNPFRDNPRKHIKFGAAGEITGLTEKGKHSIKAYNLEDKGLCEHREEMQRNQLNVYLVAVAHHNKKGVPMEKVKNTAWEEGLDDTLEGRTAYSAAVIDYINFYEEHKCPPK